MRIIPITILAVVDRSTNTTMQICKWHFLEKTINKLLCHQHYEKGEQEEEKEDKDDNRWGWGQGQLLMSKVQDEEEEVFQ